MIMKNILSTFFVFTFASVCALAGCSSATEPTGQNDSALFSNDQAAFEYFVGQGLTAWQAAGIVGNLDEESGVNPGAVQLPNGPGRGIAQWSTGGRWDSDANDNVFAFAAQHGGSPWSLQIQLDFIWYELTTFPAYGLAQLRAATNVADATVAFMSMFEVCGICAPSQRIAHATDVLNAYGQVNASGCTPQQVTNAAHFGCACADGQASGGFCSGTGCTTQETNDAANFGCACVDGKANGGFCPGSGCTAKETNDAAKFGCACVDHKADGGFCPGTGCTEKETADAAKVGCGCVDHKANGGFCAGTGCTFKETNDCKAKGKTCSMHVCK